MLGAILLPCIVPAPSARLLPSALLLPASGAFRLLS